MLLVITGAGTFHHGVVQLEESRSLRYPNCDGALRPVVHEGHDMKLPLFYRATRMKELYDFQAEMYCGAFRRGASDRGDQGATLNKAHPLRHLRHRHRPSASPSEC